MTVLVDTNILIDHLRGLPQAIRVIERLEAPAISIVSWMEVMAGVEPDRDEVTRRFLHRFRRIPVEDDIAEAAARVRRERRIKLPDAVIWATARSRDLELVTRNTRDFPPGEPWVRVPYSIQ